MVINEELQADSSNKRTTSRNTDGSFNGGIITPNAANTNPSSTVSKYAEKFNSVLGLMLLLAQDHPLPVKLIQK